MGVFFVLFLGGGRVVVCRLSVTKLQKLQLYSHVEP